MIYSVKVSPVKYWDKATEIEVHLDNGKPYEEAVREAFKPVFVQLVGVKAEFEGGKLKGRVSFYVHLKDEKEPISVSIVSE